MEFRKVKMCNKNKEKTIYLHNNLKMHSYSKDKFQDRVTVVLVSIQSCQIPIAYCLCIVCQYNKDWFTVCR